MPALRSIAIALTALAWISQVPGVANAGVADPGDVLVAQYQVGVVRIEPTSNRRSVLEDQVKPWELAFTPDGELIIFGLDGAVHRMDLDTGAIATVYAGRIVGHNVEDAVVGPDGAIYAVDDESLYKLDPASGQVSVVFDRVDCQVSCTNADLTGVELSTLGGFFVTLKATFNTNGGFLLALDPVTHTSRFVRRVGIPNASGLVEDADGTLLVAMRDGVVRVDPATGEQEIVSQGGKLLSPYDIAVSGEGKIYLTELDSIGLIVGGSQVVEIDPATGVQRILARPVSVRGIAVVPGTPAPPDCRDGIDNDGDGRVDFVGRDEGCSSPDDGTEEPSCADGIDNDGDGLVDFGADPGCAGNKPLDQEAPQCNDRYDNDGDGLYDYPEDPECLAPFDNTEHWAPRRPHGRDL